MASESEPDVTSMSELSSESDEEGDVEEGVEELGGSDYEVEGSEGEEKEEQATG